MEYENFTLNIKDKVAILKLSRPEQANALKINALEEFAAALESVRDNEEVCSVLLYGAGKHFCAGNDVAERAFSEKAKARQNYLSQWEDFQQRHVYETYIYSFPKPTVAAVHGSCLGAGMELISLFDFVIASEDAKFGLPEMRMSIVPLTRLAFAYNQLRFVKEMVMTGENVTVDRAYQMGLINHIVPRENLMDEAMILARKLALMPPETMRVAKEAFNRVNQMAGYDIISKEGQGFLVHSLQYPTWMRQQYNAIGKEQGPGAAFKWQKEYFAQAEKPFEEQ
ncbi:MAG TPA: enoyl-CoA hydratase/isomerase family protein [Candidatus Acidoferrum sp.]|nr:enoyl-CoA hydratase/isomerase family protein [Candidatus Acidoferrum sp.]